MICRAIPFEGSESHIFVSYCHKDKDRLYPIFEQMVRDGYRMWYDDGNHGGDDWLDNIENHLENCKIVIAFISDNSSLSHNCKSEITYALKCKKKVMPVLLDDADLPKGLRMQLSHLHYIKSVDYSSDKALLAKIYECEECKECKAPAGSLMLKEPQKIKVVVNIIKKGTKLKTVSIIPAEDVQNIQSKKPSGPSSEDNPSEGISNTTEDIEIITELVGAEDYGKTLNMNAPTDDIRPEIIINRNPVLLIHPAGQRAYIIRKPQTRIGSSPIKCDVVIEGNSSVSRYHADIIQYGNQYFLRDVNSTNGTFINGTQLGAGKQEQLENPAVFLLGDEMLILVSDRLARKFVSKKRVCLLINNDSAEIRLLDAEALPLNRDNKWPEGTLSDRKVHRAAHAQLKQENGSIYLVDESPEYGNGTYLNGNRMEHGESRMLHSGDCIRLGDTTLEFISITL